MLKHCAQIGHSYKKRKTKDDYESKVDEQEGTTSSSPYNKGIYNKACEIEINGSLNGNNLSATKNHMLSTDTINTMRKATSRMINHNGLSLQVATLDSVAATKKVTLDSVAAAARKKVTLNSIEEEPADVRSTRIIDSVINKEDSSAAKKNTFELLIYVLIVLAAVFCGLYGVAHHYIGYYPESEYLNEGDMKLIEYSTWFCSEVYTDKTDAISKLVVLSTAETANSQFNYRKSETLSVEPGDIWMRSFYLLKNSLIKIIIESKDIVDIFGFDNEKSLEIWKRRKESTTYILKRSCCTNSGTGQYHLIASSEGRHFVIIYRSYNLGSSAKLNTTMEFRRTTFDFSKTEIMCDTITADSCSVPLKYGSSQVTVVEVPKVQSEQIISFSTKINWKCNARIWFYFVVFGSVYILILLIILTIYFLVKRGLIHRCLQTCKEKSKRPSLYNDPHNSNRKGSQFSVLSLDSVQTSKAMIRDNNQLTPSDKIPNKKYTSFYSVDDETCSCSNANSVYSENSVISDQDGLENEECQNKAKRSKRGKEPISTGIAAIYREGNIPQQQISNLRARNNSDTIDSGIFLKYNSTDKNRNSEISEDECEQKEIGDLHIEVLLDWGRKHGFERSSISKNSVFAESEVTNSEFSSFSSHRSEILLDWPLTGTIHPDYFEPKEALGSFYPRDNSKDISNVPETTALEILQVPVANEYLSSRPADDNNTDISSEQGLTRTKSTGYFRVYSPISYERTGAVAGRRELRSTNPIFYRPMSPISFIDMEICSQTGIEI